MSQFIIIIFLFISLTENNYEEIQLAPHYRQAFAKQVGLPSNPWGLLINRVPCNCDHGICGCCTGMFVSAWKSIGCLNLTYIPEDFSFEFKMIMNDNMIIVLPDEIHRQFVCDHRDLVSLKCAPPSTISILLAEICMCV